MMALLLTTGSGPAASPRPLPWAHAHNDYLHSQPLREALAHGYTSVEADVFLQGDRLCVAHEANRIVPERTLQALYLDPLRQRVQEKGGRVHPQAARFLLLIDIKTAADPTYRRLHDVLAQYQDMLTTFGPQGRKDKAVLVVVSGNRPLELMRTQTIRYASYDGRLTDLDSDLPADLMPLISDSWVRHFTWRGSGPIPEAEARKLDGVVRAAHAKGRLVRFWQTPDAPSREREAVWRQLLAAGVDLISTDDLKGLQEFLLQHGR
ncbi:MAG: phosphatidylinositol-specific phospholipase C/glycerophosphodiester phosphodiesterase family protein [Planctomycetes bacterium]|jgi:hypothetical protein|nr:phosphatidylinositol-specific phospholipase C/glycerophosphodiester phosphodiesterase family protein [Planctomycetota bacterium]